MLFLAAAAVIQVPQVALGGLVVGLTLAALALLIAVIAALRAREEKRLLETLNDLTRNDATPELAVDVDGVIRHANPAARQRLGAGRLMQLEKVLEGAVSEPAAILRRLHRRALAKGQAGEDVILRDGRAKIEVQNIDDQFFFWKFHMVREAGAAAHGEAISLPMMTVSPAGNILSMNAALRRLLGGRESSLERVVADPPLRPGGIHHVMTSRGPRAVQVIEAGADGGPRELYLNPLPAEVPAATGEWGLVEALPVPLLRLGRDGRVRVATHRARALLGGGAIVGERFAELVEGLGRSVSDWLEEAWEGRNLGRTETLRASRVPDRFIQVSLEHFPGENGSELVAVLTDATAYKSLEHQFVQSQKMQAIGQLAGGVAHDFNNLLTAITGHCDLLLLRHPDDGDPDFADLSQIIQNANRAAALVGQLLAFSRKQTLNPERIEPSEIVSDLAHLLGRLVGETVTLDVEVAPGIWPIRADPRQIEQVLMNLVVNARDAMMPQGGQIRLVLGNLKLREPLSRDRATVPPGRYVIIRVIDTGHGIAPDNLGKIFEPFFTTKGAGKGTGLGLSMVYGIVKQSGGYVFADSIPGEGTTFTLYFPAMNEVGNGSAPETGEPRTEETDKARSRDFQAGTPNSASRNEGQPLARRQGLPDAPALSVREGKDRAAPEPAEGTGHAGRILLVEDEAPVRAFAARALRLLGHVVIEAEDGEKALALLEDEDLEIDVFVTDVVMPGLDGPTWVARALERRPTVRVVFMSGYAEETAAEHQARIPNSVFLQKPFSLSALTDTVARQLGRSRDCIHAGP
ncbi:MAG: response regulator [Alphaproteobacteria bacterium]|nr:MAG: response regulator [Alphaproteobacteria bacterium]